MKITILGCGAAGGVPSISEAWGKCDPENPKNRRRRPSILLETSGLTLLIDSSPDLRDQLLSCNISHLDGILYTHAHADHLHGIDDLREVNRAMKAPIAVYGTAQTLGEIGERFGYVFAPMMGDGKNIYKPWLIPHEIGAEFSVGPLRVTTFDQDHGFSRTIGFRFGAMAYSTDVLELPEPSMQKLQGLDLWIVGCMVDVPHVTHAHIAKALAWREILQPKRMVITHMGPSLDYAALCASLPEGVEPAYDGMVLTL